MINWFISILLHKGVITKDEAKKLADELPKAMHPVDFNAAHKIVENILNK